MWGPRDVSHFKNEKQLGNTSHNKGERRGNEREISVRGTAHERPLTLGNEQGGRKGAGRAGQGGAGQAGHEPGSRGCYRGH